LSKTRLKGPRARRCGVFAGSDADLEALKADDLDRGSHALGCLLHELTDRAYFKRTVLVASAHNMPVESYPWRFSSVISVGSHEERGALTFYANPDPPVEFFARGVDVEVAWTGGARIRCTGNSFATPHMTGLCALVLGKHPDLTPFQLKSVLYLTSSNVGGGR
jgi:subtilisin family serine protease